MENKESKELITLYVMVPRINTKKGNKMKVCFVNCNKLPSFSKHIPTKEILKTHFQVERLRCQKDKSYHPQPLYLQVDKEEFDKMYEEVYRKDSNIKNSPNCFSLTLGQHVPCCIITYKD